MIIALNTIKSQIFNFNTNYLAFEKRIIVENQGSSNKANPVVSHLFSV